MSANTTVRILSDPLHLYPITAIRHPMPQQPDMGGSYKSLRHRPGIL